MADFLPTMFDRFTRAESSRARHSGGVAWDCLLHRQFAMPTEAILLLLYRKVKGCCSPFIYLSNETLALKKCCLDYPLMKCKENLDKSWIE